MKLTFKQILSFLSSMIVITLGWAGSLTFAQADMRDWHILIPSILLSWIIFIPAYNFWTQFFMSIFSKEKEETI